MSMTCPFCGSRLESEGIIDFEQYGCGRERDDGIYRTPQCYQREIAALKAENATLKGIIPELLAIDVDLYFADGSPWCPFCKRWSNDHAPDCVGERARALSGEKKEGKNMSWYNSMEAVYNRARNVVILTAYDTNGKKCQIEMTTFAAQVIGERLINLAERARALSGEKPLDKG